MRAYVTALRWGPQEEDTQKYKRKQKLYLSDRVSPFLNYKSARNLAHAMAAFFTSELLLMLHSLDAHVKDWSLVCAAGSAAL